MPSRDPKRPLRELYGTGRWQKFRRAYLTHHPLCSMCKQAGRTEPASVVDHKIPHRGDEQRFWMGPFQAMCKHCHDSHKQSEERTGYSRQIGSDGWPIDPKHPGNQ